MSDEEVTVEQIDRPPGSAEIENSSTPPVGQNGRTWISQASGFTYRTLRDVSRSWTVLAVAIGLPPIMYLLVTVTREFDPITKATFAIGIAVLGAMIASLTVFGSQLAVDLEADRFIAYRSMAVRPSADFAGRVAAGLLVAALALAFGLGVGILDGAPVGVISAASVAVSVTAFIALSLVFMAIAVPIVVAANNEQYAQFALSLIAVFGFMLSGYNGMLPSVAVFGESIVELLPNVLATRAIAARLVTAENMASVGFLGETGRLVPLVVYSVVAATFGVLLTRWQLYDKGIRQ
jgi:ABC-2 type transport system permease protein